MRCWVSRLRSTPFSSTGWRKIILVVNSNLKQIRKNIHNVSASSEHPSLSIVLCINSPFPYEEDIKIFTFSSAKLGQVCMSDTVGFYGMSRLAILPHGPTRISTNSVIVIGCFTDIYHRSYRRLSFIDFPSQSPFSQPPGLQITCSMPVSKSSHSCLLFITYVPRQKPTN